MPSAIRRAGVIQFHATIAARSLNGPRIGDGTTVRRLLRALERAGLVEMDDTGAGTLSASGIGHAREPEPDELPERRPEPDVTVPEPPRAPAAAVGTADALIDAIEARPFEDIYAEHAVPVSPFPAERLLRVLDGLAALEPAARKTAVIALDAADDAWTVDDSLLDAERKLRVLSGYRDQVEQQTRALLSEAKAASEAREQRQQDAVARIRQQIADLEGLLEREVARASEDQAEIKAGARETKDACARELARVDEEITQLRRIAEIFGGQATAPPPSAD